MFTGLEIPVDDMVAGAIELFNAFGPLFGIIGGIGLAGALIGRIRSVL